MHARVSCFTVAHITGHYRRVGVLVLFINTRFFTRGRNSILCDRVDRWGRGDQGGCIGKGVHTVGFGDHLLLFWNRGRLLLRHFESCR